MQVTGVLPPVEFISTSTLAVERPVLAGRSLPSFYVGNFRPVSAMNKARPFKSSWSVHIAKFLTQLPRLLSPLLMNTTMLSKGKSGGCRNWTHMNGFWKHFLLFPLSGVTDSSGVTLAHVAAREGHLTCIQTLVDHDIDVTIPDKDGRSPADYAYSAGQTGCARYLVMEESCWLLSVRIAKLHKELKDCKEENKELRQRLEASCYLCCRCLTLLYLRPSDSKTSMTKKTRFFLYN